MADYLHNHAQFADLLRIVAEAQEIDAALVEKDYWIMHGLHGLQQLGISFELKGGTSLSKGLGIIHRFSEDIDIRIEPDASVATGRNHTKAQHVASREAFYDGLAGKIAIDGVTAVERDRLFDDARFFSGGIRLRYPTVGEPIDGLKDGILLEVGFANVQPNAPRTISSWAYDQAAASGVEVIDNRAVDVPCYHPGYTLVEKLQAISTKFRQQQAGGEFPPNFMRHYYDVFCLLQDPQVQTFIGTAAYHAYKKDHFPTADNLVIAENDAFGLSDPDTRAALADAYKRSAALYYRGQPPFDDLLSEIGRWADRL
ncbi:MAG: nucleotidyl transferase AbiEii/AbiGii toxin family protein [Phenylobacterium sp.]|uniref:nucleotidyl transferase AbiEii/AbiGii toxin family protein n=1 Tax=Phenylobacterium sp. TaxID=1871053 RepID=UPI001A40EE86|nr:nucleotidyl transferase AbiEii/AbiGii toxin family protein [Phenylobacterium sp.]MBL8552893.1 nucleotidyl transferase AbiEii/AbiGii toxin family protein [Phenylobacterium sp.]